jgi:sugar transferase (PEP-CTERM/EpsH1 system associated)
MPFDVVVTFSSSMGQYAAAAGGSPLIADFVDMDSQKWSLYAAWSRWPRSWVYATEASRLLRYERWLARRAYCTLVRTEAEQRDCQQLVPEASCRVLANGVDLEYFQPLHEGGSRRGIVFTGVMDYFPNVHAMTHFCDDIFPLIRQKVPAATFTIVGSRPTRAVIALGRHAGVSVVGAVPDMRPYLGRAAIAVAPMRLARGVQNKVLEAMAMATPVMATSPVARGVGASDGDGIRIADLPEVFSERIVELLGNPARASELGRRGRCFVERHCVWETLLLQLETVVEEAVNAQRASDSLTQARNIAQAL